MQSKNPSEKNLPRAVSPTRAVLPIRLHRHSHDSGNVGPPKGKNLFPPADDQMPVKASSGSSSLEQVLSTRTTAQLVRTEAAAKGEKVLPSEDSVKRTISRVLSEHQEAKGFVSEKEPEEKNQALKPSPAKIIFFGAGQRPASAKKPLSLQPTDLTSGSESGGNQPPGGKPPGGHSASSDPGKGGGGDPSGRSGGDVVEQSQTGAETDSVMSAIKTKNVVQPAKDSAQDAYFYANKAKNAAQAAESSAARASKAAATAELATQQIQNELKKAQNSSSEANKITQKLFEEVEKVQKCSGEAQLSAAKFQEDLEKTSAEVESNLNKLKEMLAVATTSAELTKKSQDEVEKTARTIRESLLDRKFCAWLLDFCGINHTIPKSELSFSSTKKLMKQNLTQSLVNEETGLGRFSAKLHSPSYYEKASKQQLQVQHPSQSSSGEEVVVGSTEPESSTFERETRQWAASLGLPSIKTMGSWDRHRVFAEPAIFIENDNGRLVGGIRFQIENLLGANTISPIVGDRSGIRNYFHFSFGVGSKHDLHLFSWKDGDTKFKRVEYGRCFRPLNQFSEKEVRPVLGAGIFIKQEKGENWVQNLSFKKLYLHAGFEGQDRIKPFLFVKGTARILIGLPNKQESSPAPVKFITQKEILESDDHLQQIQNLLQAQQNEVKALNSQLSLILDKAILSSINHKIQKLHNLTKSQLEESFANLEQNLTQKFSILEQQQEENVKTYSQKLEQTLKDLGQQIEDIPEKLKDKVDLRVIPSTNDFDSVQINSSSDDDSQEKSPDNFLEEVGAFLTTYHLVQGILIGLTSGVVYIVLTHSQVKTNDPWMKFILRVGRRTISYAYPVALGLAALNCTYNLITNQALYKKWAVFEHLSFDEHLPDTKKISPLLYILGVFVFNVYDKILTCSALWFSFKIFFSVKNQPFFIFKLGMSFLITRIMYGYYLTWLRDSQDLTKVLAMDREDMFSFKSMFGEQPTFLNQLPQSILSFSTMTVKNVGTFSVFDLENSEFCFDDDEYWVNSVVQHYLVV